MFLHTCCLLKFSYIHPQETFIHCAKCAGFGFKIDEIVQAWNEMYDAKRWQIGVPSFRLEPLFRRRVPKLHHILENL